MLRHYDHVTVAVTDLAAAIAFSGLLDFGLDKDVIVSGPAMDRCMGRFLKPPVKPEGGIARLDCIGFCLTCFSVSGIDALIDKATAAGVRRRNDPMVFYDHKLVFLAGPEGITVELAEWK